MNLTEKMISFIEAKKVSSTMVSDALGKDRSSVIEELDSLTPGAFVVAKGVYVFGNTESNYTIHKQIELIPGNCLLYVDMLDQPYSDRAIFGEIVSRYLFQEKKVKGIIVNGKIRDYSVLFTSGYPIWFRGKTPLGCFNEEKRINPDKEHLAMSQREKIQGSIMVCDDTGCTFIKKALIQNETLNRLKELHIQELVWSECMAMGKWSTYDVICKKIYKKDRFLIKYLTEKYGEAFLNLIGDSKLKKHLSSSPS